ncbi:MAG: hypothetical protein U1E26_09970 [Coriobacteriia bacterium]|nr:hypothetical protein [Coriobacteriia bacterium]
MIQSRLRDIGLLLVALVGASGWFVSSTVLMEELPDAFLVLAACVGALAFALALAGVRRTFALLRRGGADVYAALAGGAAAFAVAPLLVLSQRASDAPPGTEVLLFTTSAWALIACVAVYAVRPRPRSSIGFSASLLGLFGGLVILANWERPSSLSPFVRFPEQHLIMLVAGVIFAAGAYALWGASRRLTATQTAALATVAAAFVALIAAIPAAPSAMGALPRTWSALLVLGVFGALLAIGWIHLAASTGLVGASGSLLLVPATLTGLSILERSLSVYGPDPIQWEPVLAGIALSVGAVSAQWLTLESPATVTPVRALARSWPVRVAAVATLGLAAASAVTPGITVVVAGAFGEEYRAAWVMPGIEVAVGWLAIGVAALATTALLDAAAGRRRSAIVAGALAVCAPLVYPMIANTPLRTATKWIPADVSQTLGTEYARITFAAVLDPVRVASIVVSVAVAIVAITLAARSRPDAVMSEGTP